MVSRAEYHARETREHAWHTGELTARRDDRCGNIRNGTYPQAQCYEGRDHWPYTPAMIISNTITGGRALGAYTENFSGVGFDPRAGLLIPKTAGVSSADFVATLLTMADIDSDQVLPNTQSFAALIR